MPDPIATVLRLVAEGRVSPEEASAILAALDEAETATGGSATGAAGRAAASEAGGRASSAGGDRPEAGSDDAGRAVRVEVSEAGEIVVDLRLPASLGDLALRRIPGLSEDETTRIRDALRRGLVGDILRVADDVGNGVRISVE